MSRFSVMNPLRGSSGGKNVERKDDWDVGTYLWCIRTTEQDDLEGIQHRSRGLQAELSGCAML